MKKKIICLSLLAAAAGAMLAACGPTGGSSDNTGPVPPTSSSVEVPPSSTSENTDVWATRVKITQPGIVVVGDTLKVSEIVELTPANANKFTVVSTNEDVVTVGNDNDTLTIVGAGTAGVQIKGATNNVLGQININAMSVAGKALQEYSDAISNDFILDAAWTEFGTTWANVQDGATGQTDKLGLLVNPNYVYDGTYGAYSAISLEKADGATYGFELLNGSGKPVSFAGGFKNGIATAASVEIGDKCSAAYLDTYFVLDGLLDVADYTEGDDGWFTMNDSTQAQELVGAVFGMVTDSYTGVGARVKMENGVLLGEVRFDASGKTACEVDFTLENNPTPFDVLENAVEDAEPPVKLDVTELSESYEQFVDNYALEWEVGLFNNSTLAPLSYQGTYAMNTVGTTIYTADAWVYACASRTDTLEALDLTTAEIGGYFADETGLYLVGIDETGTIIADGDPVADLTSVYDAIYSCIDIDFDVLDGASLSIAGTGEGVTAYSYDPTFDGMVLWTFMERMSPFGYGFYKDPTNAQYCQGQIVDYGDAIEQDFFERVRISTTQSGLQGYEMYIHDADEFTSPIGQKAWEAFPAYFEAPAE